MKKFLAYALLPCAALFVMAFTLSKNNSKVTAEKPTFISDFVGAGYKVGDVAQDFKLSAVDGLQYSMSTFKDAEGFIVIFTCNTCPVAKKYEQRIINLHNAYFRQGFPVLAINSNNPSLVSGDSFEEMKKRAIARKYPFFYLADTDAKVCNKFGASNTPHVYLLNKNRVVKYIGAIDDNADDVTQVKNKYLENAILALKTGKNPDPSLTKAIGCGIKKKGA